MTTEIYKRVVFNDGEGMTFGDANDAQDYMRAVIWDKIVQNLIGNTKLTGTFAPEFGGLNGVDAPNHLAYCLHGGQAYLRPGSATNKVQISPGVLMQKVGTSDGSAATILAYAFAGTEEVSISAGNASNPRVDLIQMQLSYVDGDLQSRDFQDATTHVVTTTSMNKKKYVQCTLSVKQGSAAASPTVPDPDSGYVAVGSVLVNTNYLTTTQLLFGYDSTGAFATVMDQRMPINVQARITLATSFILKTAWFILNDTVAQSSNATNELLVPSTKGGNIARLVGARFSVAHVATDWVDSASNYFHVKGIGSTFVLNKIPTGLNGVSANGEFILPYYTFEGNWTGYNSSIVVQKSATNNIGVPIWSNGSHAAYMAPDYLTSSVTAALRDGYFGVRLVSGANQTELHSLTWYWAEGI